MDKKPNYKSLSAYRRYIRENFRRTSIVRPGRFYIYKYNFSHNYPWDKLKFYDIYPLTYIWERDNNYMTGMNFHHMSKKPRQIWLNRVRKISRRIDEAITIKGLGGRPIYRIYGLNYPRVYKVLRKSKVAIRKYRFDRIKELREVDLRQLDELMKWISKTYLAVTVKQIQQRYVNYRP